MSATCTVRLRRSLAPVVSLLVALAPFLGACAESATDDTDAHADAAAFADAEATATGDSTALAELAELADSEVPRSNEAVAGNSVFVESQIHTVALQIASADWDALVADARKNPEESERAYFPATLTFDGAALPDDVGLRVKGNISVVLTEGHAFPFKLDFDRYAEDATLDGLKKLNLHSDFNGPTLPPIRDYLSYGAWRELGVKAPRVSFADVRVNGEALGNYALVEQIDGGFLARNFDPPLGALYKPEQLSGGLEYRGGRIEDYPDIGLKWPSECDHRSLLHALEVLQNGSMADLAQVFDIDGVLTYLSGNAALGNWDSYQSTHHNYYLYEALPGRFTFLPWDVNGSQEPGATVCSFGRELGPPLARRLLEDPVHGARYMALLEAFLTTAASSQRLIARLDAAATLLGSRISAAEVDGLRHDIRTRESGLLAQLASLASCADWTPPPPPEGGDPRRPPP